MEACPQPRTYMPRGNFTSWARASALYFPLAGLQSCGLCIPASGPLRRCTRDRPSPGGSLPALGLARSEQKAHLTALQVSRCARGRGARRCCGRRCNSDCSSLLRHEHGPHPLLADPRAVRGHGCCAKHEVRRVAWWWCWRGAAGGAGSLPGASCGGGSTHRSQVSGGLHALGPLLCVLPRSAFPPARAGACEGGVRPPPARSKQAPPHRPGCSKPRCPSRPTCPSSLATPPR